MATEQEQAAVLRALAGTERPVIVDLGAHHGEEYEWLARRPGPIGMYLAVEADPRNAKVLRERIGRFRWVEVIEAAIAADDGTTYFFECDNRINQARGSGSTHRPTGHLAYFPWCTFTGGQPVVAWKLDSLGIPRFMPVDLLWVDIQGAERDMIAGGTETLKRTRFIMIEAEEVEMYEGQALKPELLALLPDFEVVEDFGYNVLLKRREM